MRIVVLSVGVFACRANIIIIIVTYSFSPAVLEIHGRSKWLIVIQLNCFFTKILCVQKALTFIMVCISFSRPFLQSVWCCLLLLREWALGVLPGGRVSPGQAALWLEQRLSGLSDDGSLPAVHPLQGGAALYQRAPAAGQSVSLQAVILRRFLSC